MTSSLRTVLRMQGIFFTYGILPEIIGKWCTKMPVAKKDGTIPIPATADTSDSKIDNDDQDDIRKCWLLTI